MDRIERSYTRDMLRLDPAEVQDKLLTVLAVAEWVSPVLPVLAVEWAAHMAVVPKATPQHRTIAVAAALRHAGPAYAVDPIATREALMTGYMGNWKSGLDYHFSAKLHELEPEMAPGPWGFRLEGRDRLRREQEEARTVWDRLRDTKHRLLHRPGPNDVTISMNDWPEP